MDVVAAGCEHMEPRDHPARVVDGFVESLDTEKLGIEVQNEETGRPCDDPKVLLKALLYGYSLGERLTCENLAMLWLTGNLQPDYRTIARFWQKNVQALTGVWKETLRLYREAELAVQGSEGIFIDGTKIKADASDAKTYDEEAWKKMAKKVIQQAEEADKKEDARLGEDRSGEKLDGEALKKVKERIEQYREQLEAKKGEEGANMSPTMPNLSVMQTGGLWPVM